MDVTNYFFRYLKFFSGYLKQLNLAIANRSRVSCISTNNNNTMTLKSSLEVTQCH